MIKRNAAMWVIVMAFALMLVVAIGWVMNIVSLIHATGIGGLEVARAIGVVFIPLGAALGYF